MACAFLFVACAGAPKEPPALEPPRGIELGVEYHAGGIIAGPQPTLPPEAELEPAAALALDCRVIYVDHLPDEGFEPLESATRFVASIEEGRPIVPNAQLLRTAGLAEGDAVDALYELTRRGGCGRWVETAQLRGALPLGATAVLFGEAVEPSRVDEDGRPRDREANVLGLHVARMSLDGGPAIELALGLRDSVPPWADDADDTTVTLDDDKPKDLDELKHELVLLRPKAFDGQARVALVIPSPFQEAEGKAFLVFLEVSNPPDQAADSTAWEEHVALADEAREAIVASAEYVADRAKYTRPNEALLALLRAVLLAQDPEHLDVDALFGLARSVRAAVVQDLILAGDTKLLVDLARSLADRRDAGLAPPADEAELAWILERTAWQVIATRLLEGVADLTTEGLALRHLGELGRYPTAVLDIASEVADLESFYVRVVEENLVFLSDSHPASRVRAYEWLERFSRVPEDYDPLGEAADRRVALAAFAEELNADPDGLRHEDPEP